MSGHVEREYLFYGCNIPKKFMDAVYSPSWDARNMRFQGTAQANYGEAVTVKVSAECNETLDYFLGAWAHLEVVK